LIRSSSLATVNLLLRSLDPVDLLFIRFDLNRFMSEVETQPVVNAQVLIRDPDEGEKCDQVSVPVLLK